VFLGAALSSAVAVALIVVSGEAEAADVSEATLEDCLEDSLPMRDIIEVGSPGEPNEQSRTTGESNVEVHRRRWLALFQRAVVGATRTNVAYDLIDECTAPDLIRVEPDVDPEEEVESVDQKETNKEHKEVKVLPEGSAKTHQATLNLVSESESFSERAELVEWHMMTIPLRAYRWRRKWK